jgi:hypothetical protein
MKADVSDTNLKYFQPSLLGRHVFNLVEQRHGSIEWNTTLEFDFSTHTAN